MTEPKVVRRNPRFGSALSPDQTIQKYHRTDPNGNGAELVEDVVNHPAHYTKGGIECIDAIRAALTPEEFRGYCKGNALKYIWRNGKKAPGTEVQDAEKAIWYLAKFNDTF